MAGSRERDQGKDQRVFDQVWTAPAVHQLAQSEFYLEKQFLQRSAPGICEIVALPLCPEASPVSLKMPARYIP